MTRLASGPDLNPLILDNLPTEQHRARRLLSPAMIGMLAPKPGDTAGILAAYHRAARIAEGKLQPVIDLLEPVTTDDLNGVRKGRPRPGRTPCTSACRPTPSTSWATTATRTNSDRPGGTSGRSRPSVAGLPRRPVRHEG